jgi:hypothetical protein
VLASLCCSLAARSDPPPTSAPAMTDSLPPPSEVTADASPAALKRRVDAFVRTITRNPGSSDEESLVRWNTPICLLVAGLAADDVKLVLARLSQISSNSGAPVTSSQCQPNFIVVATSEPNGVLNAWYARDSRLFGNAPSAQIRQFLESSQSRPARLWYNVDPGRKSGTRNGHFIPSDTRAESSAFAGNAAGDFLSVIAIIDTHRMEHIDLVQLADYVAMAGLTRVNLDADLDSTPSILRLFSASTGNQASGLSSWDAAFLKALYQSNQASKTQRVDIAERMTQDLLR